MKKKMNKIGGYKMNKRVMLNIIGIRLSLIFILGIISLFSFEVLACDLVKIKSLKGMWKFNIGDENNWKSANYNDGDWEKIYVPSSWENQGFYGYDGYAWYRQDFELDKEYEQQSIYLCLGYIDDVDEVYINGNLIGFTGSFPPRYTTAYNASRKYLIPKRYLNFEGKNTIAVRVFDSEQAGGIVGGDIGIYIDLYPMPIDIELEGVWKFKVDDDLSRRDPAYDDSKWDNIIVPCAWENQGYRDFNGYAWYRNKFYVSNQFKDKQIVVVLGKIDDVDEVYLNGQLINPVKKLAEEGAWIKVSSDEYRKFRAYYIDGNLLKANSNNVIAVRVFDHGGAGGIYEGPVGIVEMMKFVNYWRNKDKYK